MIQHYKFIQQEKRTWLEGNEVGAWNRVGARTT